jgi:hypothetical protein
MTDSTEYLREQAERCRQPAKEGATNAAAQARMVLAAEYWEPGPVSPSTLFPKKGSRPSNGCPTEAALCLVVPVSWLKLLLLGSGCAQRDHLMFQARYLFKQARGIGLQCLRCSVVSDAASQPKRSLSLPTQSICFVWNFHFTRRSTTG